MELNERLRQVRNNMGLTQADFAELGGVKVLAQTNYERGVRAPSLEYLLKLKESGVDIHFILFGEVVDTNRLSSIEHKLLFAYQNASKERKQAIEFVAGIQDDIDKGIVDDSSSTQIEPPQDKKRDSNSFSSTYYWGDVKRNAFNLILKVVPIISMMVMFFLGFIHILTNKFIPLFSVNSVLGIGSLGISVSALVLLLFLGIKGGDKLLNYQDSNLVRLRQLKALLAK